MHGRSAATIYSEDAHRLWQRYSEGYITAGNSLIPRLIKTKTGYIEFGALSFSTSQLVYPIIFLYRHFIELRLKQIILECNDFLRVPIIKENEKTTLIFNNHKLIGLQGDQGLWDICRNIIEELLPNEPRDELNAAEETISYFSKMDYESYNFRYPVDTQGNLNHSGDNASIDLTLLRERMSELDGYLEGTIMIILGPRGMTKCVYGVELYDPMDDIDGSL